MKVKLEKLEALALAGELTCSKDKNVICAGSGVIGPRQAENCYKLKCKYLRGYDAKTI